MSFLPNLPLASIDAVRPVFMIVMGIFLIIVAWRMAKESEGWASRLMVGGAFLLCFGYAILMPMYEAGKIERYHPAASLNDPAAALAWHAVKLVVMNAGWLVFGLGLGLHSGLLRMPVVTKLPRRQTISTNESVA
jgi:hypothetical protein